MDRGFQNTFEGVLGLLKWHSFLYSSGSSQIRVNALKGQIYVKLLRVLFTRGNVAISGYQLSWFALPKLI